MLVLGYGVWGLGFKRFRAWGLGFKSFRVWGLGSLCSVSSGWEGFRV